MPQTKTLSLGFINNLAPDRSAVIFRDVAGDKNELEVIFHNTSGEKLLLKGGLPEKEDAPSGPASFYLYFSELFKGLPEQPKISRDGWASSCFTNANGTFYFALSPESDMEWAKDDQLVFKLKNVHTSFPKTIANVSVDYLRMGTIPDNTILTQLTVLNPQKEGNKNLAEHLDYGFIGEPVIYVSPGHQQPISNQLCFYLHNPNPNRPLSAPNGPEGKPEFTIHFVYSTRKGIGTGALTSQEDAQNIRLSVATNYGNNWDTSTHNLGKYTYWKLLPKQKGLLGTGEKASVQFIFKNIVSHLQPGLTSFYVSYTGLPGYNDGVLKFPVIVKEMPRSGLRFELTQEELVFGEAVNMIWSSTELSRISISYPVLDKAGREKILKLDSNAEPPLRIPLTGDTSIKPKIDTTISFRIYDKSGSEILPRPGQKTITVVPPKKATTVSFSFVDTHNGKIITNNKGQHFLLNPKKPNVYLECKISAAKGAVLSPGNIPALQDPSQIPALNEMVIDTASPKNEIFTLTVYGFDENGEPKTITKSLEIIYFMSLPIGSIIAYSGTTDPEPDEYGLATWLLCDGRQISKTNHPALTKAIGSTYGSEADTIYLPDFRGRFLRGTDQIGNGSPTGRDPDAGNRTAMHNGGNSGNAVGSVQTDAFKSHGHIINFTGDRGLNALKKNTGPKHQAAASDSYDATDSLIANPVGGTETRPTNAAVNFLIRVK